MKRHQHDTRRPEIGQALDRLEHQCAGRLIRGEAAAFAGRWAHAHFEVIGLATIKRKRIGIAYYARSTDRTSRREISPQRLVHYRGNWYLDAWCHMRNDLRTFAIDGILEANVLETAADDVANEFVSRGVQE